MQLIHTAVMNAAVDIHNNMSKRKSHTEFKPCHSQQSNVNEDHQTQMSGSRSQIY